MTSATFEAMMDHEVLSRDEELALLTDYAKLRAKHGANSKQAVAVRNQIVRANMKLVAEYARKQWGLEYEDRIACGVPGLVKAVEKFEVERGLRFASYASWWVRQSIQKATRDLALTVRVPCWLYEASRVDKSRNGKRSYALTLDGVVISRAGHRSFDAPITGHTADADDGISLYQIISADGETALDELHRARMAVALRRVVNDELTPRERDVIERRFGLRDDQCEILEDIGNDMGVTRERVRQIEADALRKLRDALWRERKEAV